LAINTALRRGRINRKGKFSGIGKNKANNQKHNKAKNHQQRKKIEFF
jgi:hypothetical protein